MSAVALRSVLRARQGRGPSSAYAALRWVSAGAFVAVLIALVVSIVVQSSAAFAHSGIGFLWSGTWNPAANQYGAGILVVGTLVTTAGAMVLAVPVGLGVATYLSEFAPRWVAAPLSAAVEFLAAVPSIVVGLWALLVLSPVFASTVEPFLHRLPVLGWFFHGPSYGPSILLASVVLAVMTLPTIVALSRSALRAVPPSDREGAMALGATKWQVVRRSVVPSARSGVAAAVTLAVGRALGESIAVAMVIGNRPAVPHSLLSPGATLGSAIVNQFAEATDNLATSSIIGLAAVLLLLTVAVNAAGQARLRRRTPRAGTATAAAAAPGPAPFEAPLAGTEDELAQASVRRRTVREAAQRSLRRRRAAGGTMQALCLLAVVVGAAPLVALLVFTVSHGAGALSLGFLTHAPTPPGIPGGGISTAIVGTASIIGLALAIAVPVALLAALFLYERSGRLAAGIRFGAEVLTGVPSIVIGIFAYALLVRPMHGASTLAAGFAVAVLMLPIMIRANEESLRTVATDLWEAGVALGARRSRVARTVVLPGALPGIVTGNLLALARGVGETAPLLFTVAAPTAAMTLFIFAQSTSPFAPAQQAAWGTALVLLAIVLATSVAARGAAWALTRRTR